MSEGSPFQTLPEPCRLWQPSRAVKAVHETAGQLHSAAGEITGYKENLREGPADRTMVLAVVRAGSVADRHAWSGCTAGLLCCRPARQVWLCTGLLCSRPLSRVRLRRGLLRGHLLPCRAYWAATCMMAQSGHSGSAHRFILFMVMWRRSMRISLPLCSLLPRRYSRAT